MELLLRNKNLFLSAALLLFAFICACTNETKDAQAKTEAGQCKAPANGLNPNGSSELSLLMRAMQRSADSAKQIILAGGVPQNFPAAFKKIHTAQPTDGATKKESFGVFAAHYLNRLEILSGSSKEDVRKNYNAMVEACLSCHYDHCPGPIKAINKLKL